MTVSKLDDPKEYRKIAKVTRKMMHEQNENINKEIENEKEQNRKLGAE